MPSWFRPLRSIEDAHTIARSYNGPTLTLRDPALADYLGIQAVNDSGERVTEHTAMGLSAVWRAVHLTAGTLAGLPLRTLRDQADGTRVPVPSWVDRPGGALLTPFEWKQMVFAHMLLHGNAYLLVLRNGAGAVDSLFPIPPHMVTVTVGDDRRSRLYTIDADGERITYGPDEVLHVMGLSLDGIVGMSPIQHARNVIGTGIAADRAAARMFANGMLLGGIVTADENLDEDQAETIVTGLKAKLAGTRNAGDIAIVNAALKFTPWTMNAEDAQFFESRQYQVTEVARLFGLPVQLLAADGASSWGSGIQELVRGWTKFTLTSYTTAVEERISTLLPSTQFVEFDFQGLNQGSPAEEIALLVQQVQAGILTVDEARAIRNMPPLPAIPAASAEVEQALNLATAAPSLVQAPGLVALVNELRALNGKPPLENTPAPAGDGTAPAEGNPL